jgi:hypothetical protein
VGSDASLGRLNFLSFENKVTRGFDNGGWASNDPFRLRADLGRGAWRPHLMTRMQELRIAMLCDNSNVVGDEREYDGAIDAAAVWAPLAPTVTKLELICRSSICHASDLETGMYAGLGVLTGLRTLDVKMQSEPRCPVNFELVHLRHLTALSVQGYRGPPINLASFPRLVHVKIESVDLEPLMLSSVAEHRRLASLSVSGRPRYEEPLLEDIPLRELATKPRLNLAQLFGGGRGLAALTALSFERVELAWGAAAVAGAPPAAGFAAGAAALLPSLRSLEIKQDVEMEEDVREFVVPAAMALGRG